MTRRFPFVPYVSPFRGASISFALSDASAPSRCRPRRARRSRVAPLLTPTAVTAAAATSHDRRTAGRPDLAHADADRHLRAGGADRRRAGDGEDRSARRLRQREGLLRHLRALLRCGLRRANRSDRDKLDNDDTVTIILEPFLDYLRGYSFAVNGYGVQSDSMIVVQNAHERRRRPDVVQRALRFRRPARRRRLDGRDRHPDQEPAVPESRKAGEAASLGIPGPPGDQGQGRIRRLVAGLAQQSRISWARSALLTGMTDFSTQRNFELLPTFTAVRRRQC